jgi:uncharacterized membrane protein (UPF0182 family)
VKAVVDAYNGDVTFYVTDSTDPIIKVWEKAFPKLFTSGDKAPADLKAHFRYPQDLFRVQTNVWGRYHIQDPGDFYQRSDAWNVAQNPPKEQQSQAAAVANSIAAAAGVLESTKESRIPPYYTIMVQPGTNQPEFVSLRSFVPFSDDDQLKTLTAFMTASSDPSDYGKLRVYQMSTPLPDGPSLADSQMKSEFAQQLTLLDQSGSRVTFGDQQMLPIGNNLLYVRTWYVQATGPTAVPVVQSVTVTYGQSSYQGSTLEDALNKAFGVNLDLHTVANGTIAPLPGPGTGDNNSNNGNTTTTAPSQSTTTAPPAPTTTSPTTPAPPGSNSEQLLAQAQQAYADAQAALAKQPPDLTTYAAKLTQAYNLAAQAASVATGTTVTPAAASTPTTANA